MLNLSGWFDEPYGPVGAVTNYTGLVRARDTGAPGTAPFSASRAARSSAVQHIAFDCT